MRPSGRRISRPNGSRASSRASQARSSVWEWRRTPPFASSSVPRVAKICFLAVARSVWRRTSARWARGRVARAVEIAARVSKFAGRSKVRLVRVAVAMRSTRKVRGPRRRWQWPTTYQQPLLAFDHSEIVAYAFAAKQKPVFEGN